MGKILIAGSGGLAREFSSFFRSQLEIAGFVTRTPDDHEQFSLPGSVFEDDVTPQMAGTEDCVIAIGDPATREKLATRLSARGFRFPPCIHQTAVVATTDIGAGVIIAPNVTIGPDVKLGNFTYVNFSAGIGHDCVLGNFTQVGPGVQVGGNCKTGERVILGANAFIRQGLTIGTDSTVGAGSAVFARVRPATTVTGNPARRLKAVTPE